MAKNRKRYPIGSSSDMWRNPATLTGGGKKKGGICGLIALAMVAVPLGGVAAAVTALLG